MSSRNEVKMEVNIFTITEIILHFLYWNDIGSYLDQSAIMYDLQKLSVGLVGASLVLLGATLPYHWSNFLMFFVSKDLMLTPTSMSHDLWQGTPVPISMHFYFWNWTNPQDILNNTKPVFTEMGPYTFKEVHEKVNVSWNENNTVTFQMQRRWYFDEENSKGSLDDEVTTLNAVALTAAHTVRHWSYFLQASLSLTLSGTKQNISVTRRVREFLFEGYRDKLIDIARTLPQFAGVDIPFDRFGWFYKMNDSTLLDGVFTMNTGAENIMDLGKMQKWNYQNETKYYSGMCSQIRGSAGELFHPEILKGYPLTMFSAQLCRSISFGYADEHTVHGIKGYRFTGGEEMIDNGTLYPEGSCFCDGECLPSGVLNVTACRFGAPAFASFPHFHLADPYYRDSIVGMNPDPDKHTFYITLEPTTGVPLEVRARLQINVLLRPEEGISMYSQVPDVMIPMLWFEQKATLTDSLAVAMKALLFMFTLDFYIAFIMVLLGLLMLSWIVVAAFHVKRENNALDLVNNLDELTALRTGKKVIIKS